MRSILPLLMFFKALLTKYARSPWELPLKVVSLFVMMEKLFGVVVHQAGSPSWIYPPAQALLLA